MSSAVVRPQSNASHVVQNSCELFDQAQSGCQKSRDQLVLENMGLVHRVANCDTYYYIPKEDRISLGLEGLLRAIDNFDPSLGYRFSTYADIRIRERIQSDRRNWLDVHIPNHVLKSLGDSSPKTREKVSADDRQRAMAARTRPAEFNEQSIPPVDAGMERQVDSWRLRQKLLSLIRRNFDPFVGHCLIRYFGLDGQGGEATKEVSKQENINWNRLRHAIGKFQRIARSTFGEDELSISEEEERDTKKPSEEG